MKSNSTIRKHLATTEVGGLEMTSDIASIAIPRGKEGKRREYYMIIVIVSQVVLICAITSHHVANCADYSSLVPSKLPVFHFSVSNKSAYKFSSRLDSEKKLTKDEKEGVSCHRDHSQPLRGHMIGMRQLGSAFCLRIQTQRRSLQQCKPGACVEWSHLFNTRLRVVKRARSGRTLEG